MGAGFTSRLPTSFSTWYGVLLWKFLEIFEIKMKSHAFQKIKEENETKRKTMENHFIKKVQTGFKQNVIFLSSFHIIKTPEQSSHAIMMFI